jgi:hypothetical protein
MSKEPPNDEVKSIDELIKNLSVICQGKRLEHIYVALVNFLCVTSCHIGLSKKTLLDNTNSTNDFIDREIKKGKKEI